MSQGVAQESRCPMKTGLVPSLRTRKVGLIEYLHQTKSRKSGERHSITRANVMYKKTYLSYLACVDMFGAVDSHS